MIAITGRRSAITQSLIEMLPEEETVSFDDIPLDAERYFFCAGVLKGQSLSAMKDYDIEETFNANFVWPAQLCDEILAVNPRARICVMGSMSGVRGSFDMAYAAAKSSLHLYVETKKLTHPGQQLVAIAPAVIGDAGMTIQRRDFADTMLRGMNSRRGRHLVAVEVARLAHFLLYVDQGALTNIVIPMHGGN